VAEAREIDFPIFARGLNPRSGSDMHGRGEVNAPVACGTVAVMPGDIVIADEEGIVVVPQADAEYVAERAREVQGTKGSLAQVRARREAAQPGKLKGHERIVEALRAGGCTEIDVPWRPA
jgi:regulator of RNase E activity RraA